MLHVITEIVADLDIMISYGECFVKSLGHKPVRYTYSDTEVTRKGCTGMACMANTGLT